MSVKVKIGHARIDENRKAKYGKPGDQTKQEVMISDWYVHPKKWVLLRCTDPEKRELIAQAMEKACANDDIGYDQSDRYTLFENVKNRGFDPSKTTKPVESDCSETSRVCIAYAFKKDITGPLRTRYLPSTLVKTGYFKKYTSAKYCKSDKYLRRGDILCTPVAGHVVVVLNDGELVAGKLEVDGSWGKDTTIKTQKVFKLSQSGKIFNQPKSNKQYLPAVSIASWKFSEDYAKGSIVIKRIQRLVGGTEVDGWCGKNTVKRMQRFLKDRKFYKGTISGKMTTSTVKAWQNYINSLL